MILSNQLVSGVIWGIPRTNGNPLNQKTQVESVISIIFQQHFIVPFWKLKNPHLYLLRSTDSCKVSCESRKCTLTAEMAKFACMKRNFYWLTYLLFF